MEILVYSGTFPMASCPLPPVNYLWKSPLGTAYPGCQHQLVLHLFAREQSWLSQEVDMNNIKAYLRTHYPDYLIDDETLGAIRAEYLNLSRAMRTAYRLVNPVVRVPRPKHNDPISYKSDVQKSRLEDFIDPALFEQSVSSSLTRPIFSSSPTLFSDMTTGTTYSHDATPRLPDLTQTAKGVEHRSAAYLHSTTDNSSTRSFRVTGSRTKLPSTQSRTLSRLTPTSTLLRPAPNLSIDPQQLSLPVTPTRSSNRSNNIPSHNDSIPKDVGRLLFYAQKIYKARQENPSPSTTVTMSANPTQHELEIIDGTTIDTSAMRLPNPTKYIQASKNHSTIPASEAKAFCHWFNPTIDTVPDRIEGYFWYCDDCFMTDKTNTNTNTALNFNRNVVKGRFSQKRSVERHYEIVHGAVWRPALPEVDRDRDVGCEIGIVDDGDDNDEEQVGKGKEKEKEVLDHDEGGIEGAAVGVDFEMPDAQQRVEETMFEPRPRLRIVFRNIEEALEE